MAPYQAYENSVDRIQVHAACYEGRSLLSELKAFAKLGGPLKDEGDKYTAVLHRSANTYDALRYVRDHTFDRLHSLIYSRSHYSEGFTYVPKRGQHPPGVSKPANLRVSCSQGSSSITSKNKFY